MADDVQITPRSGDIALENISTEEVTTLNGSTVTAKQVQRVAPVLISGNATGVDVGRNNPMPTEVYGELVEAIEAMRFAVQSLTRSVGLLTVDGAGRVRMVSDSIAIASGNLTNQGQLGGLSANDAIPSFLGMRADGLRANITIT
jgi:hypothetical protein